MNQPASWAVWIADITSPAATSASAIEVSSKNRPRFRRAPRAIAQPTATATAIPASAPPPAESESPEAWNAASRKTAVSSPSRTTARNAIATSASAEPSASADAALERSSPASPRPCRRIQKTMNVTIATATAATTVSSPSCCCWGSSRSRTCSATAAATHSVTAAPTPSHIRRSASDRPSRRRNAATIPTMSDASRPSRNPITKVGSTSV